MVNGECFAQDYMLASRSQCSYTLGEGACPDAALSGDPATNQVELVSCEQLGGCLQYQYGLSSATWQFPAAGQRHWQGCRKPTITTTRAEPALPAPDPSPLPDPNCAHRLATCWQ